MGSGNDDSNRRSLPTSRKIKKLAFNNGTRLPNELSADEFQKLVNELRLYKAELEVQDERLRSTQERLEKARDRVRDLYESAPTGYLTIHRDGRILEANGTALRMFKLDREALLRRWLYSFVARDDLSAFFAHRCALIASGEPQTCEIRLLRGDGSEFEAHVYSSVLESRDGEIEGCRTVINDLTSRRAAERGWYLADAVVEASREGIVVLDAEYRILRVNRAFAQITGFAPDDVRDCHLHSLVSDAAGRPGGLESLARQLELGEGWSGELRLRRQSDEVFPAKVSVTPLHNEVHRLSHFALVFEDVTESKRAEEQLRYLAYYDVVTGLLNRAMFMQRLTQHMREAQRNGGMVGLLFLDLNRFKQVNDNLGHTAGDTILRRVGKRLSNCVRDSDTIARIGGDEFAVILPDIADAHAAGTVAKKIQKALSKPIGVDSKQVSCAASIGIALYPNDSVDPETLYRYADLAMFRAKELKRGNYQFFALSMNDEAVEYAELERELDLAITQGQFELYYQPIFCIGSGSLVGAEALLRWQHPRHGLLAPSASPFLQVAEETGKIGLIGSWVLNSACQAAAGWGTGTENDAPFLSVNVSPHQLMDKEGFDAMIDVLEAAGLPLTNLAMEITEHTMLRSDGVGAERIDRLRRLGVRLGMDDFGTGYSSLSYLRRLPFDILKIDHSFIKEFDSSPQSAHLVEAIISMAHALRLKVVAEGVETQAQLDFLRERGCDYVQGYLFSHPLPQGHFESLLGHPAHMQPAAPVLATGPS